MKTKTLITLITCIIAILALVIIIWQIQPKPEESQTQQTPQELPEETPSAPVVISDSCKAQANKNWAYDVTAKVKTASEKQVIYQSSANFILDFSEQSQQVKGLASNIKITENGQAEKKVADIAFLAFNQSPQYVQFGFYDDLGLTANHPMKLLNPLIKQLSVAADGQSMVYSYDPMAVNYQYQHKFPTVERTANKQSQSEQTQQDAPDESNSVKDKWQVTLADDCLIETLHAIEVLPFKLGTNNALMSYEFTAKRIPSSRSLDDSNFVTNANAENNWNSTVIQDTQLSPDITNDKMMLQAFEDFAKNRSTGQLKKAADYLMKNKTPKQLSDMLMSKNMSEAAKRELAFSLSLVDSEKAQDYILNTLTTMPAKTDSQGDVQKVRLMVALSGRSDVNENSYNRLMALRDDEKSSDNLKKNVLISGGKLAKDLSDKGQTQPLTTFRSEVKTQLQTYDDKASTAILAAGNAEIDTLKPEIINQLNNGTEKSRYAAATVLARDPENNNLLIKHLSSEPSLVVYQSTVSGLDKSTLNAEQKANLEQLKGQLQQQPNTKENQEKIAMLNSL